VATSESVTTLRPDGSWSMPRTLPFKRAHRPVGPGRAHERSVDREQLAQRRLGQAHRRRRLLPVDAQSSLPLFEPPGGLREHAHHSLARNCLGKINQEVPDAGDQQALHP
jgi:hypothetical protein